MFLNKTNLAMIFSLIAISACSSNEIGESKDVAQDKIYQQYRVKYSEGNDKANVFAQFRFGGSNGTTLTLSKPSQLAFDDDIIKVDSSGGSGAYYELNKPITNFYGKHHFVFTDINNKKFDNDFTFDAFRVNIPATASKKQPLNFSFETAIFQPGDHIDVSLTNTDSSFSVVHHGDDGGNTITIPSKELKRQKADQLTLEVILYRVLSLQQSTGEGGEIKISHALKPIKVKLTE